MPNLRLLPRAVTFRRAGAARYLESPVALAAPPATLGDLLRRAAARVPERIFLSERREGELRRVTYAEALRAAEAIAAWLRAEQTSEARVLALSGNSVDHALLMLGCFFAGLPFVPVSPAYSLVSQDFAKLKVVVEKVRPSVVFAETAAWRGLDVVRAIVPDAAVLSSSTLPTQTTQTAPAKHAEVTLDHVAKILFTSGSTGFPKGVLNTHRMLCSNQQMIAQLWPFLGDPDEAPLVLVDWLPWSHTFGGNHNLNMVLWHAGTLFIDEGKPTPAGIEASVRNLRELSPTIYFNVPAGYAALVPRLEADDELRRSFFARLRVMFYAAAALPSDLWRRLVALAPPSVFMTTAWGSTETSPLATSTHFHVSEAGNIGLPAPGVTLKLVPNGSKLEVRVRGPHVMTGYLDEPELTREAFDEEGFYKMGDAVRFARDDDPAAGLMFDGRVSEDFKLSSGTWVSVTHVRTGIVAMAGGALADVVVCGHDRSELAILAWPGPSFAEGALRDALRRWNAANPGGSTRIGRALVLTEPPSIDAGEITDKGYTNQRATLERRSARVADVYAEPPLAGVIIADR
jgi:feruloyl-CoA synthase